MKLSNGELCEAYFTIKSRITKVCKCGRRFAGSTI